MAVPSSPSLVQAVIDEIREHGVDGLPAVLELIAVATNDNRIRHAARILQGRNGGRPPIDDDAAIQEAEVLFTTGAVKSRRASFMRVARSVGGFDSQRAVAERLRRKFNARKISTT